MVYFCLYPIKNNLRMVAGTRKGRGVSLRPYDSHAFLFLKGAKWTNRNSNKKWQREVTIMDRLKRFEDCRNDLFPYIEEVLLNFYDEKMQVFLDDKSLQVISTHRSNKAFTVKFRESAKSIVCIFWEVFERDSEEKRCLPNAKRESEKMQCLINAIGEYFDEDDDMGKKLEPFECCHNDVRPYIPRVLDRLFPEKRKILEAKLDNGSLQIISSDIKKENPYFEVKFSNSVESIIYIDFKKLKKEEKSENHIIYGIAHEIGHHFAGKGESGLLEKEANDWLKKWGDFNEIIEAVKDPRPINENKGYEIGYYWACSQDSKELWKIYECFLRLWSDGKLKRWDEDKLEYDLLLASKPDIKTALNEHKEKTDNDDIKKGVAFGIMKRVREIEKQGERE